MWFGTEMGVCRVLFVLLLLPCGLSLQNSRVTTNLLEIFPNGANLPLQMVEHRTGGFFRRTMAAGRPFRKAALLSPQMAKGGAEVSWFCSDCGTEHVKWVGRCTACKQWNTVKEFRAPKKSALDTLDIRAAGSRRKSRKNGTRSFRRWE